MTDPEHIQILEEIYAQRKSAPLSIIGLAEPILTLPLTPQEAQPQSEHGTITDNGNNRAAVPSALAADLSHYKDLFSKLRFSYLEQVTKEKYLRSIVGEPPILATSDDNAALEDKLAAMKSELQAKKRSVDAVVQEMEALARDIAHKYDGVNLGVLRLETLPGEIDVLEREVEELKCRVGERELELGVGEGGRSEDPRMALGLEETEQLVEQQRRRADELQRQIEELERDLPGKVRECESAEKELDELEGRRNEITRVVRDAARLREEGGRDLLEEQGRWYQSSEVVMRGLLGVPG